MQGLGGALRMLTCVINACEYDGPQLERHQWTVHRSGPFPCKCGEKFVSAYDKKYHQITECPKWEGPWPSYISYIFSFSL